MIARFAALPALLLLVLVLAVACCPVPVAGGSETAFSATVEDVLPAATPPGPAEGGLVEARLSSGRRVRLALPVGIESPQVGALIWVEGTSSGESVQVSLLRVIEQVAARAD